MPSQRRARKSVSQASVAILQDDSDLGRGSANIMVLRILGLCACVAVATATFLTLFKAPKAPQGLAIMETTVGGVRLRFDPAYLPEGGSRSSAQLELVTVFPELRPMPKPTKAVPVPASEAIIVFRIEPQDATIDPSERPTKLYARFLKTAEDMLQCKMMKIVTHERLELAQVRERGAGGWTLHQGYNCNVWDLRNYGFLVWT